MLSIPWPFHANRWRRAITGTEQGTPAGRKTRGPLTGAGLVWTGILLFGAGGLLAIGWHVWEEGLPERSPKAPGTIRATLEIVKVTGDPPRAVRPAVEWLDPGERIGVAGRWQRIDIPGPRLVNVTLHKVERERGVAIATSENARLRRRGFEDTAFLFVLPGQALGEYEVRVNLVDPNVSTTVHEIARKRFRVQ